MPASTFVVVEIPGLHTPWIDFSAHHPQSIVDVVMRIVPAGAAVAPGSLNACIQVRNAPPGTIEGLLDEGRQRYGPIRTLSMNHATGDWLGTLVIPPANIPDLTAVKVLKFLADEGYLLQWIRIADGVAFSRCEVPLNRDAAQLEKRLRSFLATQAITADVAIEEADEKNYAKLFELAGSASSRQP